MKFPVTAEKPCASPLTWTAWLRTGNSTSLHNWQHNFRCLVKLSMPIKTLLRPCSAA